MDDYAAETYGDRIVDYYDGVFSDLEPAASQIVFLRDLAAGNTALEVGVGTGRIAIPLARAGVDVIGVDPSDVMLELLRQKGRGLPLRAVVGRSDNFIVDDHDQISLAYIVFNTFLMLTGREEQRKCLAKMSEVLMRDGRLLIESLVPHPSHLEGASSVRVESMTSDQLVLQVFLHDETSQRIDGQRILLKHGFTVELMPTQLWYLTLPQLDEMAEGAGFCLERRYGDWDCSEYTDTSPKHVSIYRRTHLRFAPTSSSSPPK